MSDRPLRSDELEYFQKYVDKIHEDVVKPIAAQRVRFPNFERLAARFIASSDRFLSAGFAFWSELNEMHNEICVANAILEDSECRLVEYEPAHSTCAKRFDFRCVFREGPTRWIEVKTVIPKSQDDWDKYQAAKTAALFPSNVDLHFEKDWLGGEFYHNAFASRSAMLNYTIETEQKIDQCLKAEHRIVFLVFCNNAFAWHVDELEDFITFYRSGRFWQGDPFQKMARHYISENKIALKRNIDHFGCLERRSGATTPERIIWSVSVAPEIP